MSETMNMVFKRELFSPHEVKEMYPVSAKAAAMREANNAAIRSILDETAAKGYC